MVKTAYVPDLGDVIYLDFDPQAGREQAKRRPALVVTSRKYNKAAGRAVVCPLTSVIKPYPLPSVFISRGGMAVCSPTISKAWTGRFAELNSM